MNLPQIELALIAPFSRVEVVFRAFNHLIAPGIGEALFVPVHLAGGDLRGVRDGCPMPWEEAWSALDSPVSGDEVDADLLAQRWPRLAALRKCGWRRDSIGLGNSGGEKKSIERLWHPCGLRFVRIKGDGDGS